MYDDNYDYTNENLFDQFCRDSETGYYTDSYSDGYLPIDKILRLI